MEKKPFGADLDFYDGEWIFPFALLGLATIFGDFIWVKQIMIIMFVIICFHTVHEHKIAFGRQNIGMRYFYAFLGFLSGIVFFALPLVYTMVSYAMCTSKLKQDGEEALLVKKRKTFVTMLAILVFASGVHAWKGFLIYNDVLALQAQQQQNTDGQITQ